MQNGASYLEYSVEALPLPLLPIALVQGKIRQEVLQCRAVRSNANSTISTAYGHRAQRGLRISQFQRARAE